MNSVSDSSSQLHSSVNTSSSERHPLAVGRSTVSSASPMVSIGTHSVVTISSLSSGNVPSVNNSRSPASSIVGLNAQSRRSPRPDATVVARQVIWAPKLKKGDKLCWTKGKLLGRGAHGSVFLGLESTSGTLVAVKEMEFDPDDAALSERLISLQTELRLLKKLEHPNIVGYYSAARQATSFLVFMEYVAGGSLSSILEQFGKLQESLVMNFATQILTGLQYLHSNSVVHSDIKCANVLISVDGVAKLADFGSARIIENDSTQANGEGGTAFWMAPEVIRQEQVTYKSDIWSFGCTVLEMLTNEIPFHFIGNAFAVMSFVARGDEVIELPPYVRQGLSSNAYDLVMRCLQRDPEQRATLQQLLDHDFFAPIRPPRQFLSNPDPAAVVSSPSVASPSRVSDLGTGGRPRTTESQASGTASNQIQIPLAILAAAGVASMAASVDSARTDISEVQVRDHLVRKALKVVPGGDALPPAVSTAEDGGDMGVHDIYNSVSSIATISLSEISSREIGSRGSTALMSQNEVLNLVSSAMMQDFTARSSAAEIAQQETTIPTHPLVLRPPTISPAPSELINIFVLDDDDGDTIIPSDGEMSARFPLDSPPEGSRAPPQGLGNSEDDGGCCTGTTAVGHESEEAEEGEDGVPRRQANKVQAILLAVTCVLVIVAVVLVILFSNGVSQTE